MAREVGAVLGMPGLKGFFVSRALSSLAAQMQAVAIGWQIYAMTGRPLALGLVGLAQFVPVVCLVFVAGQVVDRHDRGTIVRICQAVEATGAVALAAGSALHLLTPTLIYLLVLVFGAARAFEGPALQALLPGLVLGALFPQAAALSASIFQVATIAGPSVGGLLYGVSPTVPYAASALCFVAALAGMWTVPRAALVQKRPEVTLASVFGGLAFIRSRREILGAISLDLFAVLLGGATALLPIYARDILHAGPFGLGLLRAAPGIGALVVAVALARRPIVRRAGSAMFAAVFLFGIATVVFGLSRTTWLSVAALAVLGGADVVSVLVRSTLIQIRTPDAMRGRVASVNLLFIGSSNQLGEFESGVLASLVGAVPAVVLGGLGTIGVTALAMWLFPALRTLDRLAPLSEAEAAREQAIEQPDQGAPA